MIERKITMTILDEIAQEARSRVALAKELKTLAEVKKEALSLPKKDFEFEKALKKPGFSTDIQ